MEVYSSEDCQTVHSIMLVLPDGGATTPQYEPVPNVCHVEGPDVMKNEMRLISDPSLLNHTNLKMEKVNNYHQCNLDVDIEKGNTEIPKSSEESIDHLKSDHSLARALQRENCLQLGEKFRQFLMNHSPELPKVISKDRFMAERICDAPSNRSRKYKRSPSFNSRRVVLLFSIMSSIGTIILIYLTLRVKQIADASG